MITLHTYTNTLCSLKIAQSRLNLLLDEKSRIYTKYFPISPNIENERVQGGDISADKKMTAYLSELLEKDYGTGKSLEEEITEQQGQVKKYQQHVDIMTTSLKEMKGIEHNLYYEIVVNGNSVSKAIRIVAERYNLEEQTIWKNYYRKIKKDIKKLQSIQ